MRIWPFELTLWSVVSLTENIQITLHVRQPMRDREIVLLTLCFTLIKRALEPYRHWLLFSLHLRYSFANRK